MSKRRNILPQNQCHHFSYSRGDSCKMLSRSELDAQIVPFLKMVFQSGNYATNITGDDQFFNIDGD
jgi:hypothetical protein